MMEANEIREAQTQLDRCRRSGSEVYLWRGEIHITGNKPSGQRLVHLRKHEEAIRQLLGDDGRSHPWAVSQIAGGTLLYQHPRFDTGDPKPVTEETPAVMPFGKYRGAPLDALVDDVAYVDWLLQQRWFGEKFPQQRRYLYQQAVQDQRRRRRAERGVSACKRQLAHQSREANSACRKRRQLPQPNS
jgi:hypothetical protein